MDNSNTEVEQIHDEVFEYLVDRHFSDKKKNIDFFFRTRQRSAPGRDKYWFIGNEQYIIISFWMGNDNSNKSPNIYFEIRPDGPIFLKVVCRDENVKNKILPELGSHVDGLKETSQGLWRKIYTENHHGNYLQYLELFLNTDKPIIDQFIDQNLLQTYKFNEINIGQSDEGLDLSEMTVRKLTLSEFYKMLADVMRRKYETADTYFLEDRRPYNGMNLCLKSLYVRNFRGIDHLTIKSIPVDAKWIVLTGENGFGKSSILQSIAIGFFGNVDGTNKLMDSNGFIMLEVRQNNQHFFNFSFDSNNNKEPFFYPVKHVAGYGASRLVYEGPSNGASIYNLFNPNGSLINIETELKDSYKYNEPKFKLLKEAFCKLIPDLHDITVDSSTGSPIVKYIEKDNENNPYKEVIFEDLASGFRNIIAVVGDIISRFSPRDEVIMGGPTGFSNAMGGGPGFTSPIRTITPLNDLKGIVIIDELELHLHPKYQKSFPKILSEMFPSILFIASTHSPVTLLGMPPETVMLKVERSRENGITARRLVSIEKQIKNLLPNTLFTSDLFDLDEIESVQNSNLDELHLEDTYEHVEKNQERDERLKKFEESDEEFPKNLFAEQ